MQTAVTRLIKQKLQSYFIVVTRKVASLLTIFNVCPCESVIYNPY